VTGRHGGTASISNVTARVVASALLWWLAALGLGAPVLVLLLFATQYDARTAAVLVAVLVPFVFLDAVIVRMASKETARLIRYRSLTLRLERCPGRPDEALAGWVEGASGVLVGALAVRLACWHRHGGDADDTVVWQAVRRPVLSERVSPEAVRVSFEFHLPATSEASGGRDPRVAWLLTVEGRGDVIIGSFEVPVAVTDSRAA
jgi:hypothetical protein